MSQKSPNVFGNAIKKGAPISAPGFSDGLKKLERAITSLEVVGDDKIDASIDWANGYPRIRIRWKGTP
jgi:hypothetical protein